MAFPALGLLPGLLVRLSACEPLPDWMVSLGCDARFNTYLFILVFLPVVLVGYWVVPNRRWKLVWLTAMSAVFYGFWDIRFFALIAGAAAVDFWVALQLESHVRHRKAWLLVSIVFNLGILALFKYAIFATLNANSLFELFGTDYRFPVPHIILPLGISFFTFKTMSYTIDVYRGLIPACRDPLKYFAFVAMFPELVLGPIVRFSTMSEQFDNLPRRLPWDYFVTGVTCFAVGLFKKTMVSDLLAARINPLWSHTGTLQVAEGWTAALGYAVQIYFDFSGYSDMAMGVGAMLAFRFPINFRAPYQAVNPSDLWRRWHITLTTWIRDYVYIPLGGNRVPRNRFYFNLMATLILAGLWHGAGWTFIVFGAVEGLIMISYHANREAWARMPVLAQRLLTLGLWVTALVIFRAPSLADAGRMYAAMLGLHGIGAIAPHATVLLALGAIFILCMTLKPLADWRMRFDWPLAARVAVMLALSLLFINQYSSPFLYYQF